MFLSLLILAGGLGAGFLRPGIAALQIIDGISSEHVRMRLPSERESLGRDTIADLELCYGFMNRATLQSLPRRIVVNVRWDESDSRCDYARASIHLGMNQPAAAANPRRFLLHHAAREMARMGLLELSLGAEREDTEFLFEGMVKILVHEYEHSSRNLESAWTLSRLLDEMQLLGLSVQRSWTAFSGGRRCLRTAAPGITLLATLRELHGRDRPLKLFESLRKASLNQSLAAAFKAPLSELEDIWLKKVREHPGAEEITVAAEEAPQLMQTELIPGEVRPGAALQMRLWIKDSAGNLLPDGVFVKDERSGRLTQAQGGSGKEAESMTAVIPVEADRAPGRYSYRITAIDESGNLRNWTGTYTVAAP
jgi:hypothetical protein